MADKPTPGNPGTYLPIPGQLTTDPMNRDSANTKQIAKQNSNSVQAAQPFNGGIVPTDGTGNVYLKNGNPKVSDKVAAAIISEIPTVIGGQGPKGDKGDRGPKGDKGDTGPAGEVDYDLIRQMIQEELDKMLNMKALKYIEPVPTSVWALQSVNLPTELVDPLTNTRVTVTPVYTLGRSDLGTIDANGKFTAADVTADTSITVVANYRDDKGKNYTVQTGVLVKAVKVSSLNVTGPSSLNSAGTGAYAATAVYNNGTTKVVTADTATTWAIASGTIGTLTKNVLAAPVVTTNASGSIRATYVEKGVTVSGTANVTIVAPAIKPFYGAAAHPVSGTSADPKNYANWSDFVLALSGQASNASKVNTFTISQGVDQYGWYAYPKSFGLMDMAKIKGNGQPGPGGWDGAQAPNGRNPGTWGVEGPLEISVMINGASVPFYIYRTDNKVASGTFTETWVVSA